MLVGELNVSLYSLKKMGGEDHFTDDMKDFVEFVHNNNLMDVDLIRIRFTWKNGHYGGAHIQEKIDRAFIYQDYID